MVWFHAGEMASVGERTGTVEVLAMLGSRYEAEGKWSREGRWGWQRMERGTNAAWNWLAHGPLEGEEFGGGFRREIDIGEFGGTSEDGIAIRGEVIGRRDDELVGENSGVLKGLAVGHDEVGDRDHCAVVEDGIDAGGMVEILGFHHAARGAIAEDRPALFKLNDAGEEFGCRGGVTVDENDEFAGVAVLARASDGEFLLSGAGDA